MSGVGEVVGGFAAAASFSQLLGHLIKSTETLATFYHHLKDAPSQYRGVQERSLLLRSILDTYEHHLSTSGDEVPLPTDLRKLLRSALHNFEEKINNMQNKFPNTKRGQKMGLGGRLRYAVIDRKNIQETLGFLQEIEEDLSLLTGLCNMILSTLILTSLEKATLERTNVALTMIASPQTMPGDSESFSYRNRPSRARLSSVPESWISLANSWLGKLGFYGCATTLRTVDRTRTAKVCFGYKFPAFISISSWTVWLSISTSATHLLDAHIRVQNRLPKDNAFMNACARGDVQLMRQLITDGQGGVNDRLSSSGKTPLLVAIESNSLEAIKYLLQAGSDPNIGDDEGILPVFACLGIRKIKRDADGSLSHHLQRTPSGQDWLETLELLIQYGASVHEIVANKTMTMTNICNRRHGEGTLVQFFRLLVNEHYQDFDVVGRGGYSALISAIRGRNSAAAALDLLAKAGVSLDRVSKDGRHPLHLAAAEGHDSKPLEHLYGTYGINDINRQDSWGWTPLHGAIDSDSNKFHHEHCGKVRFLLANGADPNIKGLKTKMKSFRRFEKYLTPVELAAHLGTKVYENFLSDLKAAIGRTNDDDDDGMFFDAEEKWSTV